MWFIGVEVEQETSAPPPKKNPASAPAIGTIGLPRIAGSLLTLMIDSCRNYYVFKMKALICRTRSRYRV